MPDRRYFLKTSSAALAATALPVAAFAKPVKTLYGIDPKTLSEIDIRQLMGRDGLTLDQSIDFFRNQWKYPGKTIQKVFDSIISDGHYNDEIKSNPRKMNQLFINLWFGNHYDYERLAMNHYKEEISQEALNHIIRYSSSENGSLAIDYMISLYIEDLKQHQEKMFDFITAIWFGSYVIPEKWALIEYKEYLNYEILEHVIRYHDKKCVDIAHGIILQRINPCKLRGTRTLKNITKAYNYRFDNQTHVFNYKPDIDWYKIFEGKKFCIEFTGEERIIVMTALFDKYQKDPDGARKALSEAIDKARKEYHEDV